MENIYALILNQDKPENRHLMRERVRKQLEEVEDYISRVDCGKRVLIKSKPKFFLGCAGIAGVGGSSSTGQAKKSKKSAQSKVNQYFNDYDIKGNNINLQMKTLMKVNTIVRSMRSR